MFSRWLEWWYIVWDTGGQGCKVQGRFQSQRGFCLTIDWTAALKSSTVPDLDYVWSWLQSHTTRDLDLRGAMSMGHVWRKLWGDSCPGDLQIVTLSWFLLQGSALETAMRRGSCALVQGNQTPKICPMVFSCGALDCPMLVTTSDCFGVSHVLTPLLFKVLKAINLKKTSPRLFLGASVNGLLLARNVLLAWKRRMCQVGPRWIEISIRVWLSLLVRSQLLDPLLWNRNIDKYLLIGSCSQNRGFLLS